MREVHEEIKAGRPILGEVVDLQFLVLEVARRAGYTVEQLLEACEKKLEVNKSRKWPDWKKADLSKAIEHVRE